MRIDATMLIEDGVDEAWPLLDRATEVAQAHGLSEQMAWTDYAWAEAGFLSGDWDRAWEAGLDAIEVAERNAYHRAVVRA
jgi:hypothetical protein